MKKSVSIILKASGVMLLAFSFSILSIAQELRSLSGANSPNDDTNPVWIGNNTLLFTRAFHSENIGGKSDPGDIWMTQRDADGIWKEAVHRPDLSTSGYDLPLGMEDVLTLLILRIENSQYTVHQYSKFGNDWNYLRKVNFADLDTFEGLVTGRVVSGGKVILLAGKRKDSAGNEDLYVSEKIGVLDWSSPLSLGPTVNGKGQEVGPFFDPNTQLLYFSSSSHPGATGKDILISKKSAESWTSWSIPQKWEQISSRGSESSITLINKDEVIWTTTQSSDGFADLMTFATPTPLILPEEFPTATVSAEAPKPNLAITPQVSQISPTTKVEEEEVRIKPSAPIAPIESEVPVTWLVMDGKSKLEVPFTLEWLVETKAVSLPQEIVISKLQEAGVTSAKIASRGYFPTWVKLGDLFPKGKTVVLLTKAEPGSSLLLKDVNFKRGTSELEGESTKAVLLELVKFLNQNPQLNIRINGHTDNLGDPTLNKQLSLERAQSIRDFLVREGTEFESIRITGWGGTKPIASNATEAGRAKNRRVELVVEN
jgi:outer membrane protein OmpA-like peptidoglycan-associated protein